MSGIKELHRPASDELKWWYRRGPVEVAEIGSVGYPGGEARFRFCKPNEGAKQVGSHEYELTRRSCMSRVEGLTFDPKSESEPDKVVDDVALRIGCVGTQIGIAVGRMKFEVHGKPVKHTLRSLRPESREELPNLEQGNDLKGLSDTIAAIILGRPLRSFPCSRFGGQSTAGGGSQVLRVSRL
ncbi:hypothetical protein GNI_065160 [Gregarina niphandrodes]|uniref:Uncharacterized protein n=1 Tax=Gregarina niphandrodes TaxID=110365 RepID=A0A023B7V2_GRENI|nr:hypothetical protein GNI_065160 [Gregarina niphandrodes]EZG67969.1 hypothetical protein GNI_065160 [Gregarina niphandrodes]|eukprot:XP_011130118.1 hypothetical protein GNI_065160 [Gregarina niphandrodes]